MDTLCDTMKKRKISMPISLFVVAILLLGLPSTLADVNGPGTTTTTQTLSKAWKLDLSGANLDPNSWKSPFTNQLRLAAIIAAGVAFLGGSLAHIALSLVLGLGLVNLDYPLIGAIVLAYYGYKRNHKLYLVLGSVLSYMLAFGYSVPALFK